MKKHSILIFFLLILLLSCEKKVDDKRTEFLGDWHARINDYDCITLNIMKDQNCLGIYTVHSGGIDTYFSGTAKADKKHLKIGNKHFDIIEYPHSIDTNVERVYVYNHKANDLSTKLANWKMVLDGIKPSSEDTYTGEYTYYKADY